MNLSMLAIVQLCVKVKHSKQLPPKGKEKLFLGNNIDYVIQFNVPSSLMATPHQRYKLELLILFLADL